MLWPQRRLTLSWAALGKVCQRAEGGDPSPLLNSGEAAPGVLGPVLGPAVPEGPGHTGESPQEDHQDGEGTEAPLL